MRLYSTSQQVYNVYGVLSASLPSHATRSSQKIQHLLKRRRRPVARVSRARVVADLERLLRVLVGADETRRRQRQRAAIFRQRLHFTCPGKQQVLQVNSGVTKVNSGVTRKKLHVEANLDVANEATVTM